MGENRGSLGGADEPRVGPWALEAMPSETGFSAIAAGARSAAQTPRRRRRQAARRSWRQAPQAKSPLIRLTGTDTQKMLFSPQWLLITPPAKPPTTPGRP